MPGGLNKYLHLRKEQVDHFNLKFGRHFCAISQRDHKQIVVNNHIRKLRCGRPREGKNLFATMPANDEKQPLINKDARTDYSADGETSAGGMLPILFIPFMCVRFHFYFSLLLSLVGLFSHICEYVHRSI